MDVTLTLRKADYEQKLGVFFGWGRGEAGNEKTWSERQAAKIKDCVESGLRRVYHCSYNWSFLKPTRTLTLRSGARTVEMPSDCGGVEGDIKVTDGAGGIYNCLDFWNPGRIEDMYAQNPESTGRPLCGAFRSLKHGDATRAQRQEIFVFPEADQDYLFRFEYYILPNFLDGSADQAYGGPEHVETFLMSCIAVAEERYDNVSDGPNARAFARLLKSSMDMDRRKKPQTLGINSDTSDDVRHWRRLDLSPGVTINGIAYD